MSAAEIPSDNDIANSKPTPSQIFAVGAVTWGNNESDQCLLTDAVTHLSWLQRSYEATPPVSPASPGLVVAIMDVELDAEASWDMSGIPASAVIDVNSSLRVEFSVIQDRHQEVFIHLPFKAREVLRLLLRR